MKVFYHALDRACKSVVGAIPCGGELTFRVYREQGGEETFSADVCTFVLARDGEEPHFFPMKKTEEGFELCLRFNRTGLYFYYFDLGEALLVCGRRREGTLAKTPVCWQITVFEEEFSTPEWFKGGVMYQIFPDRFCKVGDYPLGAYKVRKQWGETPNFRPNEAGEVTNNDFFGGNLNGIRSKLDYLKGLGVTVVYLNPIFEAYSNHRYDTGDYKKIDGLLGTAEDFDALVKDAKKKGIRIVLDGVFNHTGADSRYFNRFGNYPTVGAYQSKDSPYADWYNFRPFPDEYDCWWGIRSLPAVNETSPSYQNFVFGEDGVIRHWLKHGIGGYRLDVADELPDFFIKKLRATVKKEDPDALIIGEVWEDASNKIAYGARREYFQGAELDSVMNYPLKDAIIGFVLSGNTEQLRNTVATLIDNYPKTVLDSLMNILGTHDTPRILTVLGRKICTDKEQMAVSFLSPAEKASAIALLKIAVLLQFTLPGVPCVYYGDENGMEGYADPFCRRCYDWERRETALQTFYRKLGKLRKDKRFSEAFRVGEYREVFADFSCLVYERRAGDQAVYVYVNRSDSKYRIAFQGRFREYLSGKSFQDKLVIGPHAFGVVFRDTP